MAKGISKTRPAEIPAEQTDSDLQNLPEGAKPIKLSSKTLAHISSGLYRSTANALKELVSNAFDADAHDVRINTNFPEFDVLSCWDGGDAMTKDQFIRLMEGGIGNSLKRVGETLEESEPRTTAQGRPIIGRIGIGMLAIAQVCYEFKVVSHHRASKTAFEAIVNLSPYRSLEVAAEQNKEEYEVGYYKCEDIKFESRQAGVLIITSDLLPTYTERYREDVERKEFRKLPKTFTDFIKEISNSKHRSVTALGDYWRLVWELSLSCPVSYPNDGPFRKELIAEAVSKDSRPTAPRAVEIIQELRDALDQYDFTVTVDGLTLRKPILIPYKKAAKIEARVTPIDYDEMIIGLPLKFRGYVFTQSSQAIYPREHRGILIRVKNVAIGDYDWTCLNYETVQGFRFDWVSGEVYVEEGLEEALNVDRHSFNEVHPHYLALQKYVHSVLKGGVFAEARRGSEIGVKRKTEQDQKRFLDVLKKVLGTRYSLERIDDSGGPIQVNRRKAIIVINEAHPLWPSRKSSRVLTEKVVIALKLAEAHSKSSESIDETVLSILREVL
jgi:hypothetical protein